MGINRIVAKPAGLERERGIEPASGVVRGVVVPEVIMLVTRPQEEVIAEHSQVNHDRRRVKVATPGIDTGFEIDRGKEKAASFNWVRSEEHTSELQSTHRNQPKTTQKCAMTEKKKNPPRGL